MGPQLRSPLKLTCSESESTSVRLLTASSLSESSGGSEWLENPTLNTEQYIALYRIEDGHLDSTTMQIILIKGTSVEKGRNVRARAESSGDLENPTTANDSTSWHESGQAPR